MSRLVSSLLLSTLCLMVGLLMLDSRILVLVAYYVENVLERILLTIMHLAFLLGEFSSLFREPIWPCAIDRFLGLRSDPLNMKIKHACFMYAIRYTTNHFRRSGASSPSLEESIKVVKSRIKAACIHHNGLAVALFGSSAILNSYINSGRSSTSSD